MKEEIKSTNKLLMFRGMVSPNLHLPIDIGSAVLNTSTNFSKRVAIKCTLTDFLVVFRLLTLYAGRKKFSKFVTFTLCEYKTEA
jgi:hypothetical protein